MSCNSRPPRENVIPLLELIPLFACIRRLCRMSYAFCMPPICCCHQFVLIGLATSDSGCPACLRPVSCHLVILPSSSCCKSCQAVSCSARRLSILLSCQLQYKLSSQILGVQYDDDGDETFLYSSNFVRCSSTHSRPRPD